MPFFRVFLPALFGMVAAAPAAHVDVQVQRPTPDEPGETREETVSIIFRAVDYHRPAWSVELRVELDGEREDTDGSGQPDAEATENALRPQPRLTDHAPPPPPAPAAAPRRADVRAGHLALPPPTHRA